jgi:hypothetical protein
VGDSADSPIQSLNLDVKLGFYEIDCWHSGSRAVRVENYSVRNTTRLESAATNFYSIPNRSNYCLNLWINKQVIERMKKISDKTSRVILNTLFWFVTILWLLLAAIIFITCKSLINCSICLLLALGTVPLVQINHWLRLAIIAFGISWSENVVAAMKFCR